MVEREIDAIGYSRAKTRETVNRRKVVGIRPVAHPQRQTDERDGIHELLPASFSRRRHPYARVAESISQLGPAQTVHPV